MLLFYFACYTHFEECLFQKIPYMKKRASHPCVFAQMLPYNRFYCNFLHNMLCFRKSRLNRRFSPEIRQWLPKTQYLQVLQSFPNRHSFTTKIDLTKRPILYVKINLCLIKKAAAIAVAPYFNIYLRGLRCRLRYGRAFRRAGLL